jgi:protein tyrosine/serine phosphatase
MRVLDRLIRVAAASVLVLSVAVSAPAQSVQGTAEHAASTGAASPALANIHIFNFGRIDTHYYRGAQPEGRDYADLAALGIKTVIDLQKDGDVSEERAVQGAGMKFYRIPMTTHEPPTTEKLASFLRLVNDPANQPVYVHCAGGRHRTGVMTAMYRMTHDGWTAERAFKEMKEYNFGADFLHPEFKRFVYGYHVPPDRVATSASAVTPGPVSHPHE